MSLSKASPRLTAQLIEDCPIYNRYEIIAALTPNSQIANNSADSAPIVR